MPRVLITPVYLQGVEGRHTEILHDAGLEVCFPDQHADLRRTEVLIGQLQGMEAVLASVERYTAEVLDAVSLRVISRCGVGYDAIDLAGATRCRVVVANTPGANKEGVAEHALAMMLAVAHGFPRRDRDVRAGRWIRWALPRLAGATVGLVGLGAIGRQMAARCRALGMVVIASDPSAEEDWARQNGVALVSFDTLLRQADVVSLHLPCTAESAGMIDAAALAQMKPGAIFINTARGRLVDEPALIDALRSGRLAGAGLDVFEQEPLPPDHPLLSLDNVLLSPHMGGLDLESMERMAVQAAENIAQLYRDSWPEGNVVNAELAGRWTWRQPLP
ncbi:MAG: phosphoglycerate dehydrogenase [Thermoguttaceae bacterium]